MEPTPTNRLPTVAPPDADRSLGELVRQLASESSTLVRQEIALARAEIKSNVRSMFKDAGQMATGGAVAAVGGLVLVAFLVALLGDLLGDEYWLSALIVGLVLVAGGGWIAYSAASSLQQDNLAPDETIDSLRTTREWAADEASDFRAVLQGEAAVDGERPPAAHPAAERLPADPAARKVARARRDGAIYVAEGGGGKQPGQQAEGSLPKRVLHEVSDDDVPGQAAKVAYFAFLALPPTFMVLFSLAGFFGGAGIADWLTSNLEQMMPGSASELIDEFVNQVVHDNAPGPFSIGLLLAIWAASNIFMALGDALNKAYDSAENRSWVKRRLIAIGVMVAFVLLFLGGSALLLAGPEIAAAINLGGVVDTLWTIVQWPLAFLLVVAAFFLVYYALPNRDQSAQKGTLFKAAAIAAALWLVATLLFRFYISNFGSYSETYGILGTVIVLLLWLYITGMVVLVGGEIASEMEE